MKLALALCVALLAVLLVQAEDEMGKAILPEGTRIANGRPATPRQFPFMAFVTSEAPTKTPRYCGGTLIKRDAVLTSAFCVHEFTKHTVRLGSIYRAAEDNSWTAVSTWVLTHPGYDPKKFINVVAIIYLPAVAPLNEYIQPVDLPSPDAGSFIGYRGIVSGWGYTSPDSGFSELLQWAEVRVIPNEICKKIFTGGSVTDRTICAGSNTTTAYHWDDGDPLLISSGGRYLQIGIFFVHRGIYNTSDPALYARMTSYLDWIKLKTGPD